ncbi:hypothetical protein EV426DRAFT_40141 [Tirmania nivea]|nr:hypothetical protein EV426DRAFT_40141 [Tirmania nivea]
MEVAHSGDSGVRDRGVGAGAGVDSPVVGPYMVLDFVEDLPLETPERMEVEITCMEAREENLYVGTSAHEILHLVLLPPSEPTIPIPASLGPPPFHSEKPSYILASRIQPPLTSGALAQSQQPYIKQILLLQGPSKILVLSSTGLLSFWSYPELSPAYDGSVKVGGTNFVGALDLNDIHREEAEAMSTSGYTPEAGSIGRSRSGRAALDNSKMVMVMGKKGVKMVKVKEEEPRLVKNVECPFLVYGARRGPIACVATATDYSLLHLEIGGIIPLFPIVSSNLSPSAESTPSTPAQEDIEEVVSHSGMKSSPSTQPPSASEVSDNDNGSCEKVTGRRASSSAAGRPHPTRSSSLQQRPRSEVLSEGAPSGLSVPDDPATKHTRASSTGSIQRRPSGSIGRNSPLSRSMGRVAGKDAAQAVGRTETPLPTRLTGGAPRVKSPSTTLSKASKLPVPPGAAPRSTVSSRSNTPNPTPPGSATSSHPIKARSTKPRGKATPPIQVSLRPHIVSPTPNEFLLITGTSPIDPGVGMFVNFDGDPTRGTIQLTKYPEEIILEEGCMIALLPASEEADKMGVRVLEVIRIQDDDSGPCANGGFVQVPLVSKRANAGIAKVMGLKDVVASEVGSRLRYDKVRLLTSGGDSTQGELEEWEVKRIAEELEAAKRISKIGGKVVFFSGTKVWRLLPSPMVVLLDSRLPSPVLSSSRGTTPEAMKEGDKRRTTILSVLKDVHGLEPTTERMFHEIAYIKQKCGVLLLTEFLSLPREEDKRQFPTELLATERALIDGSLDPRIVVSLFSGFEEELREGNNGVWVYGGIKKVIDMVLIDRRSHEQPAQDEDVEKEPEWNGRRDLLLLLRRYLSAWRQKKGFGSVSQADEKEVFWTIDAALMRCLLLLEATRSPSAQQHMAGEVDVRQELYKMCDYPSSVECFDRCVHLLEKFKRLYVLSILYQSKKMSREVLETWKRLFESGDEKALAEFGEGEDRIADYLLAKKDRELVKEYGLWLANRNQRLGIKVFADERARAKWDAQEVLEMFKKYAPVALRGYVEHLVIEQKNHAYSNELLSIYLSTITNPLPSSNPITASLRSSYEAYRALDLPKPTYRKFLEENVVPATVAGDGADWWTQRLTFLDLLASASEIGSAYDNSTMMEKLEPFKELLVAEMIVLYGRAESHDAALHLLVHDLRDFDGSIEYCLDCGKSRPSSRKPTKNSGTKTGGQVRNVSVTRDDQEKLFALVLVEALKMEDWMVRQQWVELLLEQWGGWMDPVHVLSVIPDTYSIALISKFLINALRNLVREKNESVVGRAMRRGENLRVNAEFVDKCDELGPTVQTVENPISL